MSDMFSRAEMRWMSMEDAPITVRARDVALAGRAIAVLRNIRRWDHLDSAADGPYWKRTIDEALARLDGQPTETT
jgi:hypothetical protein